MFPALAAKFADSVTVAGDSELLAGSFKRWLLVANYRKEWSVPVRVKVFDLTGWALATRRRQRDPVLAYPK